MGSLEEDIIIQSLDKGAPGWNWTIEREQNSFLLSGETPDKEHKGFFQIEATKQKRWAIKAMKVDARCGRKALIGEGSLESTVFACSNWIFYHRRKEK